MRKPGSPKRRRNDDRAAGGAQAQPLLAEHERLLDHTEQKTQAWEPIDPKVAERAARPSHTSGCRPRPGEPVAVPSLIRTYRARGCGVTSSKLRWGLNSLSALQGAGCPLGAVPETHQQRTKASSLK